MTKRRIGEVAGKGRLKNGQTGRTMGGGNSRRSRNRRVGRAANRVQDAVNDLVSAAGDSAAGSIDRAADRLREQAQRLDSDDRRGYRQRRRREPTWLFTGEPRTHALYRDTDDGKIMGVCAGIARYFGVETWIVRCLVVTGAIFVTGPVVIGYIGASLILDRAPANDAAAAVRYAALSPGQQLRAVDADYDEMELRLRRMESYITSGRYELDLEFRRIGGREAH